MQFYQFILAFEQRKGVPKWFVYVITIPENKVVFLPIPKMTVYTITTTKMSDSLRNIYAPHFKHNGKKKNGMPETTCVKTYNGFKNIPL